MALAPLQPLQPLLPFGARIGIPQQQVPATPTTPEYSPEDERSLLGKLGHATLSGLGYIGTSLDKMFGGRALRGGILGGKPRELLSIIPFSDFAGFTNPDDIIYGRELLEKAGILGENTPGFDWGDVGGFAADVALDPATYLTPFAMTAAGRALAKRKALGGTWGNQVRGADYLESQVKNLAPVKVGVATPGELVEEGTTMIPSTVQREVEEELGERLVPRHRRITAKGGTVQPTPWEAALAPGVPKGTPVALGPMVPSTTYDEALLAARSGYMPEAGKYLGDVTSEGYKILEAVPPPVQGADALRLTQRQLVNEASKLPATPLRAAVGIGLPFMDPIATFGTGERTARVLDWLGGVGTAIKKTAPIRYARALFSNPVDRALTYPVQEAAAGIKRPVEEGLLADMYGKLFDVTKELEPVYRKGINDEVNRLVYMAAEGIPIPKNQKAYVKDLKARFPERYAQMKADKTLGLLARQYNLIEGSATKFAEMNKGYLQGERALAVDTAELASPHTNYMQRLLNPLPPEGRLLSRIFGRSRQAIGGTHTAQIARNKMLDVPEGAVQFNEIVRTIDPTTNRPMLVGKERLLADDMAEATLRQHLTRTAGDAGSGSASLTHFMDEADNFITANNLLRSEQEAAQFIAQYGVVNPAQQATIMARGKRGGELLDEALQKQTAINEQAKGLSGYLKGLDPRYARQDFFKTDPLLSVAVRGAKSAKAQASATAFYKSIKGIAKPESAFEPGKSIPIPQVLEKAGLKLETAGGEKLAEQLTAKALGVDPVTLASWHVPDDVANDMVKWLQAWRTPEEVAPVLAGFDAATNLTKGWLTVPFPAFHARNLMTGTFNMWRDGALSTEAMSDAVRVLQGKGFAGFKGMSKDPFKAQDELLREVYSENVALRAGTRHTGDLMRTAAGRAEAELSSIPGRIQKTGPEIADAVSKVARPAKDFAAGEQKIKLSRFLSDQGYNTKEVEDLLKVSTGGRLKDLWIPKAALPDVLGVGVLEGAKKGVQKAVATGTLNPLHAPGFTATGKTNVAMQLAYGVGNTAEDFMRISHYIAKRRQGFSPREAARAVKKYHFDYGDITPFERGVAKRLIPFYTFSSRNLPPLLEDIIKRPAKLSASIRGATLGSREEDVFVPPYIAEGSNVVLPGAPEGYARYIASFGLPFEDEFFKALGSASGGDFGRATGQVLGGFNPFVKFPIEEATGVQLHTGRELRDLRPTFAGELMGMGDDESARFWTQLLANTPASRFISSAEKLADPRKTAGIKALNLLTGARVTDVDLGKQQEIAARAALQEFLAEKPGVKQFEDIYVKPENIQKLDPQELAMYALYKQLQKRAQKRSSEEKKQQKIGVRMP